MPPFSSQAFPPQIDAMLDRAEHYCTQRRTRLTDTRRLVLGLILQSPIPIGAYDLLDRLRDQHKAAAPPTVYRALEFLSEQGLIHRIERLAAFVACEHRLECAHEGGCGHRAQFLICSTCGIAQEVEDGRIDAALAQAARHAGFIIGQATIEIEGLCAACQAIPAGQRTQPERPATSRVG